MANAVPMLAGVGLLSVCCISSSFMGGAMGGEKTIEETGTTVSTEAAPLPKGRYVVLENIKAYDAGAEGNDDDTAFSLVIGDSRYALGKINVGKNAYRTTYKILATSAAFNPNTPICARVWNFVSEEFSKGKYTWFNPSLTATTEVTEEAVLEFIKNFGG